MSDPAPAPRPGDIQIHVDPTLEYVYRDVVSIYAGPDEVIMEFGNRHRAIVGHVSIANRIVLSVANAYAMHQLLGKTLQEAQERLQAQLREQG